MLTPRSSRLVGGYTFSDAERWATILTTAIKAGVYKSEAASWITGMDVTDPITTSLTWAEQANAFVCTTVMPDGISGVQNQELSGNYYESCVPVIQLQIARAGYRYVYSFYLLACTDL